MTTFYVLHGNKLFGVLMPEKSGNAEIASTQILNDLVLVHVSTESKSRGDPEAKKERKKRREERILEAGKEELKMESRVGIRSRKQIGFAIYSGGVSKKP